MTENEALLSALKKVKEQKENFGFMDRFNVDENWEVMKALEEIQQYRAICTVEECRTAMERMKPKKVKDRGCDYGDYFGVCPICDRSVVNQFGTPYEYCPRCGIKLDWNE